MKKIILYMLIPFACFRASAQDQFTLSEAIEMALSNNFGQQILEVSRKSSAEDLAQSKRNLLPDFQASASQGFSNNGNNGTYNVNASAVLWKGGQQLNAIRRAKVAYAQSDSKIAQAQNDLMIRVIRSFLSVVMNEELHDYQQSVVGISKDLMQQGEVRFRSGEILESDYLLLKSQYASDVYALTSSGINRDNALIELKQLLCIDPLTEIDVVRRDSFSVADLALPPLQTVIEQTLAWIPDLKIAEQSMELAALDVRIAKGAYSPSLSVNGSLGTNYNSQSEADWGSQFGDNRLQQVSLSLSIPLWDKGKTRSNVKQSGFRMQQAKLEAQQTELDLRSSLEKEYLSVVSMREKYDAAEISKQAYEENFRVFTRKFERGAVSTTDLLQQQNAYLSALNNFIQTKYSLWLNRKVIDVYMGNEINN
ncbi:MAG: TolC family protein [Bacteroidales bacterium]